MNLFKKIVVICSLFGILISQVNANKIPESNCKDFHEKVIILAYLKNCRFPETPMTNGGLEEFQEYFLVKIVESQNQDFKNSPYFLYEHNAESQSLDENSLNSFIFSIHFEISNVKSVEFLPQILTDEGGKKIMRNATIEDFKIIDTFSVGKIPDIGSIPCLKEKSSIQKIKPKGN